MLLQSIFPGINGADEEKNSTRGEALELILAIANDLQESLEKMKKIEGIQRHNCA